MVVRQEHFCCNCVCKSGGISEFIVKIVKKKKLKKGLHSNDLPDLSNGTEIKTEPTIFKKPGKKKKIKVLFDDDGGSDGDNPYDGSEGVIGEPLALAEAYYDEDGGDMLSPHPEGQEAAYFDNSFDDYNQMDFKEADFPEDPSALGITVKVEPGEEAALESVQALIPDVKLSFKFDSAGIKLEPMDYENEGQEEFDQENESLASKRKTKKKGTKRPRVKVEGDVERYPSGVKKAKKPGDPGWNPRKGEPGWKSRANPLTPKVEPDKGILMNNEENCKIYACLVCDVAVYKPTSQYDAFRRHFETVHAGGAEGSEEREVMNRGPNGDGKILLCAECLLTFKTPPELKDHVLEFHKKEHRNSRCYKCKLGFMTSYSYNLHNEEVHAGVKEKGLKPQGSSFYTSTQLGTTCYVCLKLFDSQAERAEHIKTEHSDIPKKELAKMRTDQQRIKQRKRVQVANNDPGVIMENTLNPTIFKCMECPVAGSEKFFVLQRHVNQYHSKEGQDQNPRLQCTLCDMEFRESKLLQKHAIEEHATMHRPERCPYCPLGFLSKVSCNVHKERAHPEEMAKATEAAAAAGCGTPGEFGSGGVSNDVAHYFRQEFGKDLECDLSTGKWMCVFPDCAFGATMASRVKKHVQAVHKNIGIWQCEICEKEGRPPQKFTNWTNLNHHISGVHYGVSTKNQVKQDPQQLICDICGTTVMGKAKMEQHKLRVHSDYRPYACDVCGKRWAYKHDLQNHQSRAKGQCHLPEFQRVKQKKVRCPHCKYITSTQLDLELHLRAKAASKTGECPKGRFQADGENIFICEYCQQTYKDKGALKRHIHTTHTEDIELHTCDECGKQYKHRKDMYVHKRKHHGDLSGMPYACKYCPRRYLLSKNLRVHYREKHGCDINGVILMEGADDVPGSDPGE